MPFGRKSAKPKSFLSEAELQEYAVKSLGRRMRTEVELRRLMRMRVEPGEEGAAKMAAVLGRLKEYGYLDDAAFAENYTQLRQQNEKLGERRVRQDLQRKGVAKETVREVVKARYAEVSEEALAREHLERKRIRKPENEKETARVMRRLVGAGFSPGAIYKVLRQWEVPEEEMAGLETVEETRDDEAP